MNKTNRGRLYIVPTPIGNLADVTYRAVEILRSVSLIGAEDTRHSKILLNHYALKTPMISCHKFNEKSRIDIILSNLKSGKDVALISDAGTPGISDPAAIIIRTAIRDGFTVETLPGATAFVPALVASGFPCQRFYFIGFLPDKKTEREKLLSGISRFEDTLIFYEAPHRLDRFFSFLFAEFGNREVAIARELTKIHEEILRTDLREIVENPDRIIHKGEFVIIVKGYVPGNITKQKIQKMIKSELKKDLSTKEIANSISQKTSVSRNMIYKMVLEISRKENI